MQVVVCNWVGDPFKAWVAGSSPAALTINLFRVIGLHLLQNVLTRESVSPSNPLLYEPRRLNIVYLLRERTL